MTYLALGLWGLTVLVVLGRSSGDSWRDALRFAVWLTTLCAALGYVLLSTAA